MTNQIACSVPVALRFTCLGALFVALALVGCGGGGGSDATSPQPEPSLPVATKGTLTLVAGSLGGPGNLDGAGSAARFDNPAGLAIGPTGDLYVADTGNQRIRKVTPAGVVSTVAGSGQLGIADCPSIQASFPYPEKIAVGPDTSVFLVKTPWLRKIDATGNVRTLAGPGPGPGPGNGECSNIGGSNQVAPKRPAAIAVDAFGIAYIADSFAGAIYTLTPAGVLTLLVGSEDDRAPNRAFRSSSGIALDAARNLYLLGNLAPDPNANTIVRVSQTGEIATVVPALRELNATSDIARDAAGNLYVIGDSASRAVRKITPDGRISIIAGVTDTSHEQGNVDGPLGTNRLSTVQGIAVAADGTVYVSEQSNTIRRIDPVTGDLSTLAGRAPQGPFFGPHATDRAGNVFAAVYKPPYKREASIERIASDRTTTTLVPAGLVDPGPMAVDSAGNLYVLNSGRYPTFDGSLSASVVRKITPQGEVSIFAGRLQAPSPTPIVGVDGVGPEAVLGTAAALTIDAADNLYVAQVLGAPLRKITPQGVVSTLAAALPGTDQFPNTVAADAAGNLYLASCARPTRGVIGPPNAAILKVDPHGNVTELAGSLTEVGYVDGPSAQVRFAATRGVVGVFSLDSGTCPGGLTLDAAGNVYVADTSNDAVRKITPDGVVSTAVGQKGVRGIALGPLPASLSTPTDVSLDGAGNLVIGSRNALLKVQLDR